MVKQKINCVLVDDDPVARAVLTILIKQHDHLTIAAEFDNATDTLNYFSQNHKIDIVFLDVELNGFSGIDLYYQLPFQPSVIFTTSFEHFAFTAFELGAVDYLKKPLTPVRFNNALLRLQKAIENNNRESTLSFKEGRGFLKLNSSDILFFEASKDYIKIVTQNKSHLVLLTMKSLENKLNSKNFIRVNKSYIINKEKITKTDGENIYIQQYGFRMSRMLKKSITDRLHL